MKKPLIILSAIFCVGALCAQESPKPDNSKVNKQDREAGSPTADQQKMNATDQKVTKDIRQAIVSDKSLSTYAHNIKIITQNGMVTLRGPVKSPEEKQTVVSKAVNVVGGSGRVTDEITVTQ